MDTREWEKRARELAECQDVMPKSLEELQTRVYGAAMDMADTADEKICELLEARTREVLRYVYFEQYKDSHPLTVYGLSNTMKKMENNLKHFGLE